MGPPVSEGARGTLFHGGRRELETVLGVPEGSEQGPGPLCCVERAPHEQDPTRWESALSLHSGL